MGVLVTSAILSPSLPARSAPEPLPDALVPQLPESAEDVSSTSLDEHELAKLFCGDEQDLM